MIQENLLNPYKEFEVTIGAYDIRHFDYSFNYFSLTRFETMTTGDVLVRFGDSGIETELAASGIGYGLPMVVNRVSFRNTKATPITFKFAVAIGTINDNSLLSDILTAIQNGGGGGGGGSTSTSIDLAGCTYGYYTGGSSIELVSAAANTNGIRVALCQAFSTNGVACYVKAGTGVILGTENTYTRTCEQLNNVLIPAGVNLVLGCGGAAAETLCWYEVL